MHAVAEGHTKTVKALVESDADPHAKSSRGSSALAIANFKGFTDIIQLLEEVQDQ